MKDHLDAFLAHLRDRNYSPRTIGNYRWTLEAFRSHGGESASVAITRDSIVSFLRQGGGDAILINDPRVEPIARKVALSLLALATSLTKEVLLATSRT